MGSDGRSVGRENDSVCKNDGAFGGVTACVGRDEVHGAETCRGRDVLGGVSKCATFGTTNVKAAISI